MIKDALEQLFSAQARDEAHGFLKLLEERNSLIKQAF
jgi:hypothetical protein